MLQLHNPSLNCSTAEIVKLTNTQIAQSILIGGGSSNGQTSFNYLTAQTIELGLIGSRSSIFKLV